MPAFIANYTNSAGSKRQITIQADSSSSARRELRKRGILANSVIQKQAAVIDKNISTRFSFLESGVSVKEKAIFASKLSALVDAGVPILRGLDLLRSQQKSASFRQALGGITQDVNRGEGLADAMRRWPRIFDNLTIAMVQAGEVGGVLDETLKRLATLLEENARLQNQIKGAMGYPVTVFVIAIGVFIGMTVFLIPVFAGIYKELGADLPVFTQALLNISSLLRSSFSFFLIGGLIGAGVLFSRYYATPLGRRTVDAAILKIPLFGDLIRKASTAQFCRILSALAKAGVPILLCLEIVRNTTSNSIIGDAISSSRTDVSEGIPLSSALKIKNVFPDMAISMMSIGEETGEMDAMLSKVADFYDDEVSSTVKVLTSMLEPAMIVIVGGMVAVMLVAMYLPMFSIFNKIH